MTAKCFALLGYPVEHSLSPRLHAAAFAALGLPHRYELRSCPDAESVGHAVQELRAGTLAGANVTIPHKSTVLGLVDDVHSSARRVGAANVLNNEQGKIVAYNTDTLALVERFQAHALSTGAALVLGSGGAARAAAVALLDVGMAPVLVAARRFRQENMRAAFALPPAQCVAPEAVGAALGGELLAAVVQASSAGMAGKDPGAEVLSWVPWTGLSPHALALDVVYVPKITDFLVEAQRQGCRLEGGAAMLVAQAAHALRLWLGVDPPRDAMLRAVFEDS